MVQKNTAAATDNFKTLASLFMIDLLAVVLKKITQGGRCGFRFFMIPVKPRLRNGLTVGSCHDNNSWCFELSILVNWCGLTIAGLCRHGMSSRLNSYTITGANNNESCS
jgi:hypothetical protein